MNTTTKASLGATVILLVLALVIAVQNMTELKTTRAKVADLNDQKLSLQASLDRETKKNDELMMRVINPPAPAVAAPSPDLMRKIAQLEEGLLQAQVDQVAQAKEKQMLIDRVQDKEIVREKNLTPMQRRIRDAASIGLVEEVVEEGGFTVISAGRKQNVEEGIQFAIRRDVKIVGRVEVSSLVEGENKSIASIVQGSVQPGDGIRKGDTVIMYPF